MSQSDIDEISEEDSELDREEESELVGGVSEERLSKYLELRGEYLDRLEEHDLTDTTPREGAWADYCSEHPDDPVCQRIRDANPPRPVQDSMNEYLDAREEYLDDLKENDLLDLESQFGQAGPNFNLGNGAGLGTGFGGGNAAGFGQQNPYAMGISFGEVMRAIDDVQRTVSEAKQVIDTVSGWFGMTGQGMGATASPQYGTGATAPGQYGMGISFGEVLGAIEDVRRTVEKAKPVIDEVVGWFGMAGQPAQGMGAAPGQYGMGISFGEVLGAIEDVRRTVEKAKPVIDEVVGWFSMASQSAQAGGVPGASGQGAMTADPYAMGLFDDVVDTFNDVKDAVDKVTDVIDIVTGGGGGRGPSIPRWPPGPIGPRFGMAGQGTPTYQPAAGGYGGAAMGTSPYAAGISFDDVLGAIEDVGEAIGKAKPIIDTIGGWFGTAGQPTQGFASGGPQQLTPLPDQPFPPWPWPPQAPLPFPPQPWPQLPRPQFPRAPQPQAPQQHHQQAPQQQYQQPPQQQHQATPQQQHQATPQQQHQATPQQQYQQGSQGMTAQQPGQESAKNRSQY
ncbi:hypothetical protein [Halosimplex salinum]|uniref:hypothetical protein n=1 Tax=Halosimplex salinum TaxID=1710538 RepID=UPI0013DE1605|nr:hypothetical protein [Halosimplex salinum]